MSELEQSLVSIPNSAKARYAMTEKLGPPWTVMKILNWTTEFFKTHNLNSPRVDAEYLLSEVLGQPRVMLYAHFDRPLEDKDLALYKAMIKRRSKGEPIAYIIEKRGFWNYDFFVNADVLIPRADTERLIEVILERAKHLNPGKIIDIGTGSGAIAITLKSEFKDAIVLASDISNAALDIAKKNAANLEFDISFLQSDIFESIEGSFDIIASNPPYIAHDEREIMDKEVLDYEPEIALFPNDGQGLSVYEKLIPASFSHLNDGGFLALEIGYKQAASVSQLCEKAGFKSIEIAKDYGGNERVVSGFKTDS